MNGRLKPLLVSFVLLGMARPGLAFTTNQSASVIIGESAPASSVGGAAATLMNFPYDVAPVGSGIGTSEEGNHRFLLFNNAPASDGVAADVVLGQPDFSTTTVNTGGLNARGANVPRGILALGNRLFLADLGNNRILLYNNLPVTSFAPADVVIGQPDFLSNAANQGLSVPTSQTLNGPHLLYTDGTRLFVADAFNNRVLVYNSIPVTNNSPADVVIGQPDFASSAANNDAGGLPSARTLNGPRGICLVGSKLVIGDRNNNRVLIYNNVPTSNYASANVVIGQPDMGSVSANQGGAPGPNTLDNPYGVASDGVTLYVADILNNRVLLFNSLPVTNNAPADEVLGQPDMASNGANQGGAPAANTLSQPAGLAISGTELYVADVLNNRVVAYGPLPTFTPTPLVISAPPSGNSFVYPSPATGPSVNVAYSMAGSGRVRILLWNANAELAAEVDDLKGAGVQTTSVDIRKFVTGVYYYQATLTYDSGPSEKLKVGKFFIQH